MLKDANWFLRVGVKPSIFSWQSTTSNHYTPSCHPPTHTHTHTPTNRIHQSLIYLSAKSTSFFSDRAACICYRCPWQCLCNKPFGQQPLQPSNIMSPVASLLYLDAHCRFLFFYCGSYRSQTLALILKYINPNTKLYRNSLTLYIFISDCF